MSDIIVTTLGLTGSIGSRIVERYATNLHAITKDVIDKRITYMQAIEQIRENLPLHLALTTMKLASDYTVYGGIGDLIYELLKGIPQLIEALTDEIGYRVDELPELIKQYFPGLAEARLNPDNNIINDILHNMFYAGIVEGTFHRECVIEAVLLTFTRWIFKMVKEIGSFFYIEIMKYFLVVLASFYTIVEKCRRYGERLRMIWRQVYHLLESLSEFPALVVNRFRRNSQHDSQMDPENNAMPNSQQLIDLDKTLRDECERLKTKNEQLESNNEQLESRNEQLESKNEQLESRNEQLENRNEQLESEKAQLQSEKAQLHDEMEQMRRELEELRRMHKQSSRA